MLIKIIAWKIWDERGERRGSTFVPTLIPAAFVPLHFRHKVDTVCRIDWEDASRRTHREREAARRAPARDRDAASEVRKMYSEVE